MYRAAEARMRTTSEISGRSGDFKSVDDQNLSDALQPVHVDSANLQES